MKFAVLFEDEPGIADDVRAHYMAEHLAFLDRHSAQVEAAGPLKDSVAGIGAGGLWIVNASNELEVRRLVEEDPFWPAGLRKSVRILRWGQVFAAGEALVRV